MAYLLTHFWPGGTEDQYNATIAVVHPPGGLPEGQNYHAAGPTDGGILIAAVWESKEQSDRFVQDKLLPGLPIEGGLAGPPEERAAEIVSDGVHQQNPPGGVRVATRADHRVAS